MKRTLERFALATLLAIALLDAEGTRVLFAAGAEVAGEWETFLLAREVPAIAAVALLPVLLVVVAFAAQLPLLDTRRGRLGWGAAMSMIATALAVELSTGRKARVPVFRVPFVVSCAAVAFVVAAYVAPRARAFARGRAWLSILGGLALVSLAVVADVRVLPRLYPVFHHALVAVAAVGLVLSADGIASVLEPRKHGRWALIGASALACVLALTAGRRARRGGEGLAKYDNARRIADERSAVLARAVEIAARLWPPPRFDDGLDAPDPLAGAVTRSVDARGRDLLLVTIDALRADHLGAYGYDVRNTSPELDRLAAEGVVFTHAYTPTPHTSYAISSLMTGKYMRPILALQAAAGAERRPDETWAGLFRIYGFRTAAFFPPAVWSVDGERFAELRDRRLDFEHYKIEFAAPDLVDAQLGDYLAGVPAEKPLFVWVHLFEPHEPYVSHPQHPFGEGEIERYDSEIAAADAGVGMLVRRFRAARPGAMVIVSADHGEAFGEHGARYHGTTVYEEQVRVPLIVSAPGLLAPRVETRPAQLVDLLPTALSMYAIPRPPRVRGRDLGPFLTGAATDPGIAFAEVEDAAMIARGDDRLVCNKKLATCALYDVEKDPGQLHPLVDPVKSDGLRRDMKGLVTASAALEGFAQQWPEALRRAFAGDPTAATEVAPLLDDVDVAFRRRAAEVLARLAHPDTEPALRRASSTEQDLETARWLAIAQVRTAKVPGGAPLATVTSLIVDDSGPLARWASLAAGEARAKGVSIGPAGELRAFDVLTEWLPEASSDGDLGRAILAVMPLVRDRGVPAPKAIAAIVPLLADVRLRVAAADALGGIGDPSAATALRKQLAGERHQDARVPEARALAKLGDPARAIAFLTRFLGVPVPAPGALEALVAIAKAEVPPWLAPVREGRARPMVPQGSAYRLYVLGDVLGGTTVKVRGAPLALVRSDAGSFAELAAKPGESLLVEAPGASWVAVVPRVDDLPPPKPPRSLGDVEEPHDDP